ncbi:type IV pilus modification protein PilV [Pseudomonas sp. LTJR-52]|uniref:type IV pilus modification protein PilV n=1 Tax=Pseudomonas sp. LTJR-52 TaxID=2479392 RepID=UPI0021154285|nr:type IV pilus modification protein PilV [Pseudomonas sp. LTJR-52]
MVRHPYAMAGFSMIEILVSLLILCVGLLGMASLQVRSMQLTQSSTLRSNAVMLADDLLEIMRSNPDSALSSDLFGTTSSYYKVVGSTFTTVALASGETCATLKRGAGGSTIAGKDMTCWLKQVKALLPVTDAMIKANFAVCPSKTPPASGSLPYSACESTSRSVVMIVLAWQDDTESGAGCTNSICYYTVRAEL